MNLIFLTKSPLFQFEIAFSDFWIFLTQILVFHVLDKQTRPNYMLPSTHTTLKNVISTSKRRPDVALPLKQCFGVMCLLVSTDNFWELKAFFISFPHDLSAVWYMYIWRWSNCFQNRFTFFYMRMNSYIKTEALLIIKQYDVVVAHVLIVICGLHVCTWRLINWNIWSQLQIAA